MPSKNGTQPGRYESPIEAYPGFIQFPYPFTYRHFQTWWKSGVEPIKKLSRLDFEAFNFEWEAVKRLLLDSGDWQIEGIKVGEVETDDVPMEVISFVVQSADEYIYPLLPAKKQLLLSTIT